MIEIFVFHFIITVCAFFASKFFYEAKNAGLVRFIPLSVTIFGFIGNAYITILTFHQLLEPLFY